jgi:sulfite reductase (NADPH) flavoprotein alpha-component
MLFSSLTENNSVLDASQLGQLQQLAAQLNPIQQAWVSGYLAASSQMANSGANISAVAAPQVSQTMTIIYGSHTGNGKGIAQQLKQTAEQQGLAVELISAGDYKVQKLKKETYAVFVVSTHGEGEAPEDAENLHKFIFGKKAPDLSGLNYAVLALGDSSYEFYCQTGKDFDEQLAKLGATRLCDRVDCDVDYEEDAQKWSSTIIDLVEPELKQQNSENQAQVIALTPKSGLAYTKKNPYQATLLASQPITGRGTAKDVRHIEIDLEGSGIHYVPGDSLGVWFNNDNALVSSLLTLLNIDAQTSVTVGDTVSGKSASITELLSSHFELTQLHPGFVTTYAKLTDNPALLALAEDKAQLREYIADRQVIDVVAQYPATVAAEDFVTALRKITPRLYSIASAQAEVEDEVHLTVAVVEYNAFERDHFGGASGFLAHRVAEDETVNVYVEQNNNFRLPENTDTPVIMIGPGTGIAPFRAFLQQRDAQGADGDNWLFFGNQHFTQDFLYQIELQDLMKRGVLNELDVAFSRDQAEKVYVQDRMLERSEELYQWLENGAHLYICGDGNRMAKDVHNALIQIVQTHGKLDAEQAEEYLGTLRTNKRYQKDVY